MSGLRSIEMQVALPRTQTAGKIQDQMQQRSAVAQEHLAQAQEEKDVKQKKSVTHSEAADQNKLNADEERGGRQQGQRERNRERREDVETLPPHPFKGNRFDASC